MLVSYSSLNPLPLDKTCPQVVCPDVGTPCTLPQVSCGLVPWCMIFLEVMHASGTFVPGFPPWEVISSRPMCLKAHSQGPCALVSGSPVRCGGLGSA